MLNENIGLKIEEALAKKETQKYLYEMYKRDESGYYVANTLEKIINYCIILRDNIGIEDSFYKGDWWLVDKVSEKLGIDKEQKEVNSNAIFDFVYENLIEKGFVFHTTNSVFVKQIKNNGLGDYKNDNISSDINCIFDMLKKYDCETLLFPFVKQDIDSQLVYYDETPRCVFTYMNAPEWMKVFCDNAAEISEKRQNIGSFCDKDYEKSLESMKAVSKEYEFSEEDSEKFMQFFNKYWQLFEKSTPVLMLIPQENVPQVFYKKEYAKESYQKIKTSEDNITTKIEKLIKEYDMFSSGNRSTTKKIETDNCYFVDLSGVLLAKNKPKKIELSEISEMLLNSGITRTQYINGENYIIGLQEKENTDIYTILE